MPNVVIIHHSPFADEEANDQGQPEHFARDGSDDDGDLIDAHLALAEAEVRYWKARKAGDVRAAKQASAEAERLAATLRGDDEQGESDER